uniref:Uncharacterized protein n=1 Tax=Timema poppense TaxID=170557 RepID=A0A7R9DFM3_TIMPO|nr:unnamed protein product [Timema poppensis]
MQSRTRTEKGVEAHRSLTDKRKTMELLGCLHGDVFNQEKYILNDTKLRIKLNRSRDGFSLMAVHEVPHFKVHIVEVCLLVVLPPLKRLNPISVHLFFPYKKGVLTAPGYNHDSCRSDLTSWNVKTFEPTKQGQ